VNQAGNQNGQHTCKEPYKLTPELRPLGSFFSSTRNTEQAAHVVFNCHQKKNPVTLSEGFVGVVRENQWMLKERLCFRSIPVLTWQRSGLDLGEKYFPPRGSGRPRPSAGYLGAKFYTVPSCLAKG
jgi:hypothetical protein